MLSTTTINFMNEIQIQYWQVQAAARHRPEGYLEDMNMIGRRDGEYIYFTVKDYAILREKYAAYPLPKNCVSCNEKIKKELVS